MGSGLADSCELVELALADSDDATLEAIEHDADRFQEKLETLEFRRMFANPADPLNCFVDIQAGAGGTEAQDWASMLLRQYLKYAERKGFKAEILEESEGDVAGLKSATIKIEGEYAFGYLRTETGVHRLVRKSPFDSSGGRHASFASVFVYPEVDESFEVEVNPADLRTTPTAPAARAASTSTRPTPPCASHTRHRVSWCSARTTARSIATGPRRCRCSNPSCTSWKCATA